VQGHPDARAESDEDSESHLRPSRRTTSRVAKGAMLALAAVTVAVSAIGLGALRASPNASSSSMAGAVASADAPLETTEKKDISGDARSSPIPSQSATPKEPSVTSVPSSRSERTIETRHASDAGPDLPRERLRPAAGPIANPQTSATPLPRSERRTSPPAPSSSALLLAPYDNFR
jgi:hypothetical protein